METPDHTDHDHDSDRHGHNHGDVVSRMIGPRAEIILAGLAGVCLLTGWLGPKLGVLPDMAGFGFLLAAYFFGGYFALREALGKLLKGQFQIDFLIPATLFGLGIGPAVLIHEGSTLIVVFNALRLLVFDDGNIIHRTSKPR